MARNHLNLKELFLSLIFTRLFASNINTFFNCQVRVGKYTGVGSHLCLLASVIEVE